MALSPRPRPWPPGLSSALGGGIRRSRPGAAGRLAVFQSGRGTTPAARSATPSHLPPPTDGRPRPPAAHFPPHTDRDKSTGYRDRTHSQTDRVTVGIPHWLDFVSRYSNLLMIILGLFMLLMKKALTIPAVNQEMRRIRARNSCDRSALRSLLLLLRSFPNSFQTREPQMITYHSSFKCYRLCWILTSTWAITSHAIYF